MAAQRLNIPKLVNFALRFNIRPMRGDFIDHAEVLADSDGPASTTQACGLGLEQLFRTYHQTRRPATIRNTVWTNRPGPDSAACGRARGGTRTMTRFILAVSA